MLRRHFLGLLSLTPFAGLFRRSAESTSKKPLWSLVLGSEGRHDLIEVYEFKIIDGQSHASVYSITKSANGMVFEIGWFKDGEEHREGGPSLKYFDPVPDYKSAWYSGARRDVVVERWKRNGQCHREDGPAITLSDGTKHWIMNGTMLRTVWPDGTIHDYKTTHELTLLIS